jgi:hypothetical protein
MTGIIWFVQVVHYPLMARAGAEGFPRLAAEHQRRTGWVVGPPMALEGATAVLLVAAPPDGVPRALMAAGLALLAVVWASTAWLQVPRHREMLLGFDPAGHARLVRGNWVRTAAWSARAGIVLAALALAA